MKFGKFVFGGLWCIEIGEVGEIVVIDMDSMIECELIIVILLKMGWIWVMKGYQLLDVEIKFKDGDGFFMVFYVEIIDKLMIFGVNGCFYMLFVNILLGGCGMGELLCLMIDLFNDVVVMVMFVYDKIVCYLVVLKVGDGFIVFVVDILVQIWMGKQVLNGDVLLICIVVGDYVVCVGENCKMLVFFIVELLEMGCGKGVWLQKFKDGGLLDVICIMLVDGLCWYEVGGCIWFELDLM